MGKITLRWLRAVCVCAVCLSAGCASNSNSQNVDPYEKANRFLYNVNDDLDRWALKPLADAYVKFIPLFFRTCLGNAFDNMNYGAVIIDDFLQGKVKQGFADSGRMALNSTIGLAGLFDVATDLRLPAHDNDFGLTLAQWGVKPGPYLFIPILGPSTVRDCTRYGVTILANPITWIDAPWAATIPLSFTYIVDARSRYGLELRFRNEAAIDPYVFTRTAYLQYRQGLTHQGNAQLQPANLYDEDDPSSTTTPTTPAEKR